LKTVYRSLLAGKNIMVALAGLTLVGLIALLVGNNYLAQIELHESVLKTYQQDLEKQATVLSYFYSERINDLNDLPAKREISAFFENKALGMSMKYGLRASLFDIRENFDLVLKERVLGKDRIYTRFVFIDTYGGVLVDTEKTPSSALQDLNLLGLLTPKPAIMAAPLNGQAQLIVSTPYLFKGEYSGQIIAWISNTTVRNHFIHDGGKFPKEVLGIFAKQGNSYLLTEKGRAVILSALPNLVDMSAGGWRHFRAADQEGTQREMIADVVAIKDTPLLMAAVIPADELFYHITPWYLLAALGSLSVLSLLGVGFVWQASNRHLILQTRLEEADLREEEIAAKNRHLEEEIAERLRAEAALRENEERYRLLFNNVSDAVFVHEVSTEENKAGRIIEVNEIACQYLGYTREELLQMTVPQIDAPETISNRPLMIKKLFAEKRILWEGMHLSKDGHKIPVEISNQLFDLDGKQMVLSTVRNIEKRKQAEQALMSRQAELDGIFRAAPIGIGVLTNRVLKEVNDQICAMTGYSREELLGKSSRILYPTEEDFEYAGRKKYQMIDKNGMGTVETRWQRQDGAIIDVRLTSVPLVSSASSVEVLFTAIDITERKKTEQAFRTLMKSTLSSTGQDYFDVVVNSLSKWLNCEVALVGELIDSNTINILSMQVDGELFHGKSYHLQGTPCENIEQKDFCLYSQGVRDLFPQAQNLKDLQAEGYLGIPIKDFHNQVVGTLCAISRTKLIPPARTKEIMHMMAVKSAAEIQRKRMERERENIESQLRQAQKMEAIGTLAGGIAHDFNNILGAISGFTELTLQSVPRDSQEYYNLRQVLKAGERARDLVKQILVFSRRTAQARRPLQVGSIIKEAIKLLRASLPTTIEIQPKLAAPSALVLADPTQIHQILMNLGSNAAHAMREDGGLLKIDLAEVYLDSGDQVKHPDLTPGPYVRLTVRDTGKGMDQEVMGRIFEPFFTTKEVGEGTGMGLAVVHGIVKSSGGEITVSSQPEQGTTFTILLPKVAGEVVTASAAPAPLPTGGDSILFIDDEEMLVNMTREMLKKLGYQVVAQTSSLEALRLFQAQPEKFDLVITDQTMPHMTGMQLAQEFRHLRPDIPIILCTGYSEKVSAGNIKAAGINDLLMKPIVMRNLAETIRKVLD
jgi:PAS domain S-box-containing protein